MIITIAGVLQHTFYKRHSQANESSELKITLNEQQNNSQQQQQSSGASQSQFAQQPHHSQQQQQQQQQQAQQQQSQFDFVLDPAGAGLPAYPTTIQVRMSWH